MNKFVQPRPFADPEVSARKIIELAQAFQPVQDGRIYIEVINGPFLFKHKGSPAKYKAGLDFAFPLVGWNCTRVVLSSGLHRQEQTCWADRQPEPTLRASGKGPGPDTRRGPEPSPVTSAATPDHETSTKANMRL